MGRKLFRYTTIIFLFLATGSHGVLSGKNPPSADEQAIIESLDKIRRNMSVDISEALREGYMLRNTADISKQPPELRFELNYLLTKVYIRHQMIDSARIFSDEAFNISITENNDYLFARALLLQALMAVRTYLYQDALIQMDVAEKIFKETDAKKELGELFLLRARISEADNHLEKASKNMNLAIEISTQIKDTALRLATLKYQGNYYIRSAQYLKAFSVINELLDYSEQYGYKYDMADALISMSIIQLHFKNYKAAERNLRQAFLLSMTSGNLLAKGRALKYLGNLSFYQNDLKSAQEYFLNAKSQFSAIDDKIEEARVLNNLGYLYCNKNNASLSKIYYDSALSIFNRFHFKYSQSKTLLGYGELLLSTGNTRTGLDYINKSKALAEKGGYHDVIFDIYSTLATYYQKSGNVEEANKIYSKLLKQWETRQSELLETIINLQNKIDSKKSIDKAIAKNDLFKELQKTRAQKNKYSIIALILLIALAATFLLIAYQKHIAQKRENNIQQKHYQQLREILQAKEKSHINIKAFDNLGLGIVWIDKSGLIKHQNKTLSRFSQQPVALNIEDIFPDMIVKQWAGLWKEIENQKNPIIKEFILTDEDGNNRPVEITFQLMAHHEGPFVVAILKDIAFRKETEKKLRDAKIKAEESDKIKTSFISNMSHEIRTPLNAITGFAEELYHTSDNMEKRRYINFIKQSSNRIIGLVENILELSQIESNNTKIIFQDFDLHSLLKELFEIHNAGPIKKTIVFKQHFPLLPKPLVIHSDKNQLHKVLNHLINNAFKFTQHGEIELGYRITEAGNLICYVKDTGLGIPDEYREHIFELFSQADLSDTRKFQGAGISLALAKKIMDLLGGELYYESKINHGSTFYLSLPSKYVNNEPITTQEQSKSKKSEKPMASCKILYVDDSETNMRYLISILKKNPCEVKTIQSLYQAIRFKEINQYELVLVHEKLAGGHNEETLRKLFKNIKPTTKISFVSNAASDNDQSEVINISGSKKNILQQLKNLLG
jgi:PAS domain S-box-containing protein